MRISSSARRVLTPQQRAGFTAPVVFAAALAIGALTIAHAQTPAGTPIKAQPPRSPIGPAWDKGIQPISSESYWNAVACGKQGGENPPCVFWDTGLCKNDQFTLAMYTPYKMVAHEVWRVVRQRQPPPTPSYQEAQRTRITLGVTPVPAAKNPINAVTITRGGRVIKPVAVSLDAGGGRFTFDFPAFAPTEDMTLELLGKARTTTCAIDQSVLTTFR